MSYFVIGGEDTVLGFSYVGVPGQVVANATEAAEAFDRACADEAVRVVLLEEAIAGSIAERVNRVRFDLDRPVVVEVPGPEGPVPDRPELLTLIREAVGIKL